MSKEMPWAIEAGLKVNKIEEGSSAMRLDIDRSMLRSDGSVLGQTMMALADITIYAVVLGAIGIVTLAVTTSFNINFLHLPSPADLLAKGHLLKVGKRLLVI